MRSSTSVQTCPRKNSYRLQLTKTAISAQSRAIYRAYVDEEMPIDRVAEQFGVTKAAIYKIKSRVEQMAEIVEEEFAD